MIEIPIKFTNDDASVITTKGGWEIWVDTRDPASVAVGVRHRADPPEDGLTDEQGFRWAHFDRMT